MAGPSYDDARETTRPGPPRPREPRIIDATIVEDHGTTPAPAHRRPPAGGWNAGPVTAPILGPSTTAPLPRVEDPPPPGGRAGWAAGSGRRAVLAVAIAVAVLGGVLAIVLPRLPHPSTPLAQPTPVVSATFGPDEVSALTGGPVVTGDPSASAGASNPPDSATTTLTPSADNQPADNPPAAFSPVTLTAASGRLSGTARTDPTYGVVCLGNTTTLIAFGCGNGQGTLTLTAVVPTEGNYTLTVSYYSGGTGAVQVIINGSVTTEVAITTINSWQTFAVTVRLNAGSNAVGFTDASKPAPAIKQVVVARS